MYSIEYIVIQEMVTKVLINSLDSKIMGLKNSRQRINVGSYIVLFLILNLQKYTRVDQVFLHSP